jgi:glycosyltransferase involved in cell wall biosynthesis
VHVLHVEAGRHLYGGARQVLELMTALAARGIGGLLACPDGSAIAAAARARGLAVATHPLGGDLDVAALGFLGGLLRQRRFDLLHAHSRRGADFFGGIAAAIAGVPAVLTRRVDNPDTPVLGTLKYRAYRQIVAVSSAVRAQLVAEGVPPERVRVIRSAVSAADCVPAWSPDRFRSEFGLQPGQPVIAVVAQLIPRKGHDLLLAAWPAIRARFPAARLLVFGTGPLEGALVARAGTSGGVHFAGFRPDLGEFLGHIDVLVHPALAEGLGLTLLEAQAAGVPVVGFRSGGIAEAVADGGTGILVPPGDSVALGDAVAGLLADPARRRSLGAAGHARIAAEFTPAAMAAAYAEVYVDALGR